MIDKFCEYLTNKIRKEMTDVDDERAEIIKYGLQLLFGEIPKIFIMAGIAWALGIFKWTLITFALMLPYRMYSGGFHLKTHIGCIIGTSLMYTGNAFISKYTVIPIQYKVLSACLIWIFALIMIYKYAPADTEDVPVISKKERKKRKYVSYVIATVMVVVGCLVPNNMISNILLFGALFQTITITRVAYKLTRNKYGYEEYLKNKEEVVN